MKVESSEEINARYHKTISGTYDRLRKENRALSWILATIFALIAVALVFWQVDLSHECEQRGGVLVRGIWSPTCVKATQLP